MKSFLDNFYTHFAIFSGHTVQTKPVGNMIKALRSKITSLELYLTRKLPALRLQTRTLQAYIVYLPQATGIHIRQSEGTVSLSNLL